MAAPPSRTDRSQANARGEGVRVGRTGSHYSPEFEEVVVRLIQPSGVHGKQPKDRACARCGEHGAPRSPSRDSSTTRAEAVSTPQPSSLSVAVWRKPDSSMGPAAEARNNPMAESFVPTLAREPLHRQSWPRRLPPRPCAEPLRSPYNGSPRTGNIVPAKYASPRTLPGMGSPILV